jgi:hypothetical protein
MVHWSNAHEASRSDNTSQESRSLAETLMYDHINCEGQHLSWLQQLKIVWTHGFYDT